MSKCEVDSRLRGNDSIVRDFLRLPRRFAPRNDPAPKDPVLIRRELALNSCGARRQGPTWYGASRGGTLIYYLLLPIEYRRDLTMIPANEKDNRRKNE